ncbi:response regulator transcription factor [Cellulosilyticum sp. I15G10I2]|uniref:response regulator transcription factor n=1 Tax=Cellulosilyticum sp. I15G10I2 TaxID=1892843 RepID=UPI00085C195B|nr:response regulator transcription factor [Cellulosilyticum sp. I15G10I2]
MEKSQVLIIDDDRAVRKLVKTALKYDSMSVTEASSDSDALFLIRSNSYDLILLDIMLGDANGLDLLKRIHDINIHIPIILLSGKKEENDKVLGLELGADDYITKPFSPAELSARAKAHLRRSKKNLGKSIGNKQLVCGPFTFDYQTYRLYKNSVEISLSSKELKLMKFFLENTKQVFTKDQLYESIWHDSIVDDNTIMVYIRHLRIKIEDDPKKPKYLKTVWGVGYFFTVDE